MVRVLSDNDWIIVYLYFLDCGNEVRGQPIGLDILELAPRDLIYNT